jgi:hypothetical protein
LPHPDLTRLRALLGEAADVADALGDGIHVEPAGAGYFADADQSGIRAAIDRIAATAGPITMFVGAGVSMEAELPSWNELVRGLLLRAPHAGAEPDAVAAWADSVLQEGPLAAAAVAESLYGDDVAFRRALREALYARGPDAYVPGALADQIAWLKRRLGPRLALLTVNYDGLIEAALAEHGLQPASYVRAWREPEGKAAVWHLHGRMMRAASGTSWRKHGNLVLSEGSYVRSTSSSFPQGFVAERLSRSLCVFVGLSMTDPNFIRWLYRSAGDDGGPRFVIFVRQASPVQDPRVRSILERSAAARWARYNVTPVWANYYGEVAQIVHEIGLRCDGGQPVPFVQRARRRFRNGAARLSPGVAAQYAAAQTEVSAWLRARLADIHAICALETPKIELSQHRLGLAIWAVDHDAGQIVNWVSSDRAYQEPGAAVGNPVHVHSRWVAAVAIANGVSVEEDPKVYASRWRFVRAIPVIVADSGERSVVGAVTLASTTPLGDFPLAADRAPPGLLDGIDRFLCQQVGEFFLD